VIEQNFTRSVHATHRLQSPDNTYRDNDTREDLPMHEIVKRWLDASR